MAKASESTKQEVKGITVLTDDEMVEFVAAYRFSTLDVSKLRFTGVDGMTYMLDNKGMGRYEMRQVGE